MRKTLRALASLLLASLVIGMSLPAPASADGAAGTPGNVYSWGANYSGQLGLPEEITHNYFPVQVSSLSGITAVSIGSVAALAIDSDGDVSTWGNDVFAPTPVAGLSDITAVSAGNGFYLALDSGGHVWSWGANPNGQLGLGDTATHANPTQIPGFSGIIAISAGGFHSTALDSSGNIWAWGSNGVGQLGLGYRDLNTHASPTQVPGLGGIVAISAGAADHLGYDYSLALTSGGSVYAWGANAAGELGRDPSTTDSGTWWGTTYYYKATPLLVNGLSDITAISAGGGFSLAIDGSGNVWGWGAAAWGQLGNGATSPVFQPVPSRALDEAGTGFLGDIVAVSAARGQGGSYSLALDSGGHVWAWGENGSGALGVGDVGDTAIPIMQSPFSGVTAICAGGGTGLAISSSSSASSTVALEASPSPSVFGATVDFTVTVNGSAPGEDTPAGVVCLSIGPGGFDTEYADLDGAGQALFADMVLPPGPTEVAAHYHGDSNYLPSSTSLVHTVETIAPDAVLDLGPEASPYDRFGKAVDIEGDYAVVGAPERYNGSGAAYVFARTGDTWAQQAELAAPIDAEGDNFGSSVAISGDTIVVGSPERTIPGSEVYYSGAAYVFTRSGNEWAQQAVLIADDAGDDDDFGRSVDIDGDVIVVGAPAKIDPDSWYYYAGAVYIFTRDAGIWTQQAVLAADEPADDDYFGCSVAISGDTVVVGAEGMPPDGGENGNGGAAYVFVNDADVWNQQAILSIVPDWSDNFGHSVAIEGDLIAVGNPGKNLFDASFAGVVGLYTRSGDAWTLQEEISASDHSWNAWFGNSVDLSGDQVLVGAPFSSLGAADEAGTAYMFTRVGADWLQECELVSPITADYSYFGFAVAIDGDDAIIGAFGENDEQGRAYIYLMSVPGDLDGDGSVGLADLALVAAAFGSTPGAPNWNAACDLNGDGIVNIFDLVQVGVNFGTP